MTRSVTKPRPPREAPLVTPEPVDPPDGPIPEWAETGGSLTPGLYKYAYAYYQANGGETTAFEEGVADIAVGTVTNSVLVPLEMLPAGCAGWRLYRQAPDEEEFYFLIQIAGIRVAMGRSWTPVLWWSTATASDQGGTRPTTATG